MFVFFHTPIKTAFEKWRKTMNFILTPQKRSFVELYKYRKISKVRITIPPNKFQILSEYAKRKKSYSEIGHCQR